MCCLLSGRGLCVGLRIPTECGVSESDREASTLRRPRPSRGVVPLKKNIYIYIYIYIFVLGVLCNCYTGLIPVFALQILLKHKPKRVVVLGLYF
jgi:hypothetical protein